MIAFASLFLGLLYGTSTVEVIVGDGVAAVEFRLDGKSLAVVRQPPWKIEHDFGPSPLPALLEAVALDGEEKEVARAVQWLNLPRPQAVISAILEPRQEGHPPVASLSWESSVGAEPESVTAWVDGARITVEDPRRIVLPPVADESLHLLEIEMRFEGRNKARTSLSFGGLYADEISTELTAIPLRSFGKAVKAGKGPSLAAIQGWFEKDGKPLRVVTVERGRAEAIVVLGRTFPHLLDPRKPQKIPKSLTLPKGLELRFLSPIPKQTQGVVSTFELFPISPGYGRNVADAYSLLTGLMRPPKDREARPGSAIAVAGLAAFESRRRRAVILIPGKVSAPGDMTPTQVRAYLDALHVPLLVWDPERKGTQGAEAWGEVMAADSLKQLSKALADLEQRLDQQWIVWLDGQHLPQDIELTAAAEGFTLAPR